jgi:hypothetical protein
MELLNIVLELVIGAPADPDLSAASLTVLACPEASTLFTSTTFRRISGTARLRTM